MLEHDNVVSHVLFFLRPKFPLESFVQQYKSLADFLTIRLFGHQVELFHSCGGSHIHGGYYSAYFIRGRHWEDPSFNKITTYEKCSEGTNIAKLYGVIVSPGRCQPWYTSRTDGVVSLLN